MYCVLYFLQVLMKHRVSEKRCVLCKWKGPSECRGEIIFIADCIMRFIKRIFMYWEEILWLLRPWNVYSQLFILSYYSEGGYGLCSTLKCVGKNGNYEYGCWYKYLSSINGINIVFLFRGYHQCIILNLNFAQNCRTSHWRSYFEFESPTKFLNFLLADSR